MLKQRILTAIILAPLVLLVIFYGNQWQFAALAALLQFMCGYEWLRMNRVSTVPNVVLNGVFTAAVFYAVLSNRLNLQIEWYVIAMVLLWLPAVLWLKFSYWGRERGVSQHMKTLIGLLAIVLFAVCLNVLHGQSKGHIWTLILFLLIWVADVGAYVSGKTLGKHKLAPSISPGKTWEGLLGAIVLVAIYAWIVAWAMKIDTVMAVVLFPIVAAFSVVGDLCASLGKRQAGIKDSSNFLPGHGGFIDRFDSLIAATPLFVICLRSLL